MRKKVFGLIGIGLIIIIVVIAIVSCDKDTDVDKKDENTYVCSKIDKKKKETVKHIIKLDKKNLDSYTYKEHYKFEKKADFEKKCYEKKMEESYVKSSKGVDFKETVTCNNKKKTVNVKKEYVIEKLSKEGKKSIDKVLKHQKEKAFDLEGFLKAFDKDDFDCE